MDDFQDQLRYAHKVLDEVLDENRALRAGIVKYTDKGTAEAIFESVRKACLPSLTGVLPVGYPRSR